MMHLLMRVSEHNEHKGTVHGSVCLSSQRSSSLRQEGLEFEASLRTTTTRTQGTEEVAQPLRALTAFPEDPGLIPVFVTLVPGDLIPFSDLHGHQAGSIDANTYVQAKQPHI